MTEISDVARNYRGGSRSEQARGAAALPHLRGVSVDVETRETMREAAEIAWANNHYSGNNAGWFAVVDAVVALVPKGHASDAVPSPTPTPDQRLAAVAMWRDCWLGARSAFDGIRALHSLLSELLTRVAALERGR